MGSCDRAGHDGAGGGDYRAWGGIDGERDGNSHGECDGQRGGGEGAVPGRRGECRESGDWGWAGVQLCVEHGGRGEWEPCIDGGGDGCGGECGHQRGGDGDGEQCWDGSGDLGGEREWDHGEWGDDQLDDGQGGGFAGGVWADGELWIHERVEPGAEHDTYGDAERFSGLDDVPLSGIVAGWAGEFGEFRGLHLHHGGGSAVGVSQRYLDLTAHDRRMAGLQRLAESVVGSRVAANDPLRCE